MNARCRPRGLCLGRLFAVVFDQRQVDRAIAQVARDMVSYLAGLDRRETEDLLVKVARSLDIVDLQGNMNNPVHGQTPSFRSLLCSTGRHPNQDGLAISG